jgi:hypothetical protein
MSGREFGQSTVKDLLGLVVGAAPGLPGWSTPVGLHDLTKLPGTTAMGRHGRHRGRRR